MSSFLQSSKMFESFSCIVEVLNRLPRIVRIWVSLPFYKKLRAVIPFRSAIIRSTSYSSTSSITSGGGGSGRGKVFDAVYGLRSEMWNVGCIHIVAGRSSLYATGDIFDVITKGPTKRGRNLHDGDSASAASLRFLVDNKTLSPMSN